MKKHFLCIGDSNTHGYCADTGGRYNEEERWTCLLQKQLGEEYLVIEEGLPGRTTVFPDPLTENLDVISYITALLKSHEKIDLLIIMLGTNDTKERFGVNAKCISLGMERLARKTIAVDCWQNNKPNILIIAPPHIKPVMETSEVYEVMGAGCVEKSKQLAKYYKETADLLGANFLDAQGCEFNDIDGMHLTKLGHKQLCGLVKEKIDKIIEL